MKSKIKKIVAVVAIGALAITAGCAAPVKEEIKPDYTTSNPTIQALVDNAEAKGVASVDVTSDNAEAIKSANLNKNLYSDSDLATRDAGVLADYKAAQLEVDAGGADGLNQKVVVDRVKGGYVIDDVELGASFSEVVYTSDYDVLSESEIKYDGEKYNAEEILTVSGIQTRLNYADFGSEVVAVIDEEGAIVYKMEFDQEIALVEDKELKFNFLGDNLEVISYDGNELVFRKAVKFEAEITGDSNTFQVGEQVITIKDVVNNDGENDVLVDVDGKATIVTVGEEKEVSGLKLLFSEAMKGTTADFVEFYVGEDISESVYSGDEYEADDRFEWDLGGSEDGLKYVGLKLVQTYEDEEDVLHVGDSISLPGDYLEVVYEGFNNLEVQDLTLKVTTTKLYLDFAGTVKVDGRKVDEGKLTFVSESEFEYKYKGEKKNSVEEGLEVSDILLLQGDRELSLESNEGVISVGDEDVEYSFAYEQGDEAQFTAALNDAEDMNDDEEYRVSNGDLLYTSDVNDEDDKERTVKVGLVSDKEVEGKLRIV